MNLAVAVCQGVARIGISAVLIWTMKQPIWQEKSLAPHPCNASDNQPGRPLSTSTQQMVSGHVNEQLASYLNPRQLHYSVAHHIAYTNTNQNGNNSNNQTVNYSNGRHPNGQYMSYSQHQYASNARDQNTSYAHYQDIQWQSSQLQPPPYPGSIVPEVAEAPVPQASNAPKVGNE
jgi:hypothetical protein